MPDRLRSLDVLRGLTVALMILVNTAAYLKYVDGMAAYPVLMHSEWAGFSLADAVFPAFLFMVGVSIAAAMPAGAGLGEGRGGRIAIRTARLILIGLVISNLYWLADFAKVEFRPFGVLQRIGLVYGASAALYLTTGWRTRAILAGLILLAYWPLCLIPSPDGMPTDLWARGHNFAGGLDRLVLGSWRYVKGPEGYDPEGLLGTLPAIAQGLLGTLAGDGLSRSDPRRRVPAMLAAALVMILAGLAWGFVFPIIKDVWTSPYVLLSSGLTLGLLALLHRLLDRPGGRLPGDTILMAFGINAIAAYVLHELASIILAGDLFKAPYRWAEPLVGGPLAELIPVTMFVGLIWASMDYLRRRGWVIRV